MIVRKKHVKGWYDLTDNKRRPEGQIFLEFRFFADNISEKKPDINPSTSSGNKLETGK